MGFLTRAIHDVGTAIWFGGSFMGTMAMNPAVEVLDEPEERGKMVDEGWALFQPWAAAGLTAAMISHIIMRRNPPRRPSRAYKNTARAKDALFGVALASSVASMALGEYVTHQEPDAYTPIETATEPDAQTPDEAIPAQQGLTTTAMVQLASGVALLVAGAILAKEREK